MRNKAMPLVLGGDKVEIDKLLLLWANFLGWAGSLARLHAPLDDLVKEGQASLYISLSPLPEGFGHCLVCHFAYPPQAAILTSQSK